jgi:peroxiredoxin
MDATLEQQLEAADARFLEHWLRGPTRIRHERQPVQVGDPAPDLDLIDHEGRPVRLSSLWSDHPVHLFFMRHFGCSCMRDRWEGLNRAIPKLEEAGARVVAVGQGEPARTRLFMRHRGISVPVLCDPEGVAYQAYGVIEGTVPTVLHDAEWHPGDEEGARKLMDSRRDTDRRVVDNPWIMPAEFVVDRQGLMRHAHRYQYCEDFLPTGVLLGAIAAAVG